MIDDTTPLSLLLDPRVTHLLITRDGDLWTADMTMAGLHFKQTGFATSGDAYRWVQVAAALTDSLLPLADCLATHDV